MNLCDFGCYIRRYLDSSDTLTLDWIIICMSYGVGYVGDPLARQRAMAGLG